ncbi:MAG TPA: hypothetical protein VIN07_09415 [Flavipsychrobacter sp.]
MDIRNFTVKDVDAMRALQVFLLALVLLGSYSCQAIEAKEDIYGIWLLNTTRVNGVLQFDRNDPQVMARHVTEMVEDFYGELPKDEQANLDKKAAELQLVHSKMGYRFTADSVYMISGGTGAPISGTYTFEKSEQEVVCNMDYTRLYGSTYIHKVVFRIIGGRLVTNIETKDKREITIQEYVKQE